MSGSRINVGVHEEISCRQDDACGLDSIVVVDEATEAGHPVVLLQCGAWQAELTLKAFLQTVKLVMDAYPEYVRETFRL